ncbi:hypothetical protein BRC81_10780 [Halobacteriales archaeon QS_1_68_20]|nr:MAG: hypothetical protein BRC81_10780 [Halobacteriales archaeon QS_1_68_20]
MALDPTEFTVDELRDEVEDVDDQETLEEALDAEREGKDRKTAKAAIERRLQALRTAAEGDLTADEPADDEAVAAEGEADTEAPVEAAAEVDEAVAERAGVEEGGAAASATTGGEDGQAVAERGAAERGGPGGEQEGERRDRGRLRAVAMEDARRASQRLEKRYRGKQ